MNVQGKVDKDYIEVVDEKWKRVSMIKLCMLDEKNRIVEKKDGCLPKSRIECKMNKSQNLILEKKYSV